MELPPECLVAPLRRLYDLVAQVAEIALDTAARRVDGAGQGRIDGGHHFPNRIEPFRGRLFGRIERLMDGGGQLCVEQCVQGGVILGLQPRQLQSVA